MLQSLATLRLARNLALAASFLCAAFVAAAESETPGLTVKNGWYVCDGKVVWGYAQHNGWWRAGQRPNLARRAPGEIGPNRTEDLDRLTDAMLDFAYPGFEHNFGLWYDRRRDAHDTVRRNDAQAVPPYLEQPWARSEHGKAWDGLPQYDLTKYNDWYFQRLNQFASRCDDKGTILLHNFYMQHALLEQQAHYVDFPWRPANCVQDTDMPDEVPAASDFYDVTHPLRRALHVAYIRKCLEVLGEHDNVVMLCSEEYTGPLSFMQFWLDTVFAWERETGRDVHVGISATKDVVDAVMADPVRSKNISTLDLRYWWYEPDGNLFAPPGGRDVAGRYAGEIHRTTPVQLHRQVCEYRRKHPGPALIHGLPGTGPHAWAALMGGASMLVGQLPYPEKADPTTYVAPELCCEIIPTYRFIREHLASDLPTMLPRDDLVAGDNPAWCLAHPNHVYLIYATHGGQFQLDLAAATGTYRAQWFDPRSGRLFQAGDGTVQAGTVQAGGAAVFTAPDSQDWALWLNRLP